MNRGPIVLTIDEAEYLLDQLPPPSADEDPMATKLRKRLQEFLTALRAGAEGSTGHVSMKRHRDCIVDVAYAVRGHLRVDHHECPNIELVEAMAALSRELLTAVGPACSAALHCDGLLVEVLCCSVPVLFPAPTVISLLTPSRLISHNLLAFLWTLIQSTPQWLPGSSLPSRLARTAWAFSITPQQTIAAQPRCSHPQLASAQFLL
ncbi:hypothetical protein NUW54_g13644 [Trametes sanguinea]|uniref:Uncharacterized protein n=1 Tax=Trametes sanguinea TaxID=158606 RepID=A0ACC1MJ78_9APHY|nr:hypothetical protein NUW54_g13644 [Trametes sanguinea]